MTKAVKYLLPFLLAFSLVAASCGDDDDTTATGGDSSDDATDESDESTDDATDESSDESTDEATDESSDESTDEATDESSDESTDEATDDSTDESGGSGGGICDAEDAVQTLSDELNNNSDDLPDPEYFEDLQDVVADLQDADNGDLADDLDVIHEGLGDFAAISAEADGSSDAADELLLEYEGLEDFGLAISSFEQYAFDECDIGPDLGDISETTIAAPDVEVGDPAEPPATDDPTFEALADDCFAGDGAACDELYFTTPVDSIEEAYGETCGGRLDTPQAGFCAQLLSETSG